MPRSLLCLLMLLTLPTAASAQRAAQIRQNAVADRLGLTRLKDRAHLKRFIDAKLLVDVDSTSAYAIDKEVGEKDPNHRHLYRYARPYVKAFLEGEVASWHAKFGTRYLLTSFVRTEAYQRALCRSNANAICGTRGWRRSAHLTGAAVDISRIGLSGAEDRWLRRRLETLRAQGKVVFIKEYGQYCYHVMVLPSYTARRR